MKSQDVPLYLMRTLVSVVDLGSYTKAASKSGITQPGISSQIARLQKAVGGQIFVQQAGKPHLTDFGRTVVELARAAIQSHDQILRLRAPDIKGERVRIGVSPILIRPALDCASLRPLLPQAFLCSGNIERLVKDFLEGRLDMLCGFLSSKSALDVESFASCSLMQKLVWVKSNSFELKPGEAIPIVSWSGDAPASRALKAAGISYQVLLDGEDFEAKRQYIEAGLALAGWPDRFIPKSLGIANDAFLPKLSPITAMVCIRPNLGSLAYSLKESFERLFDVQDGALVRSLSSVTSEL